MMRLWKQTWRGRHQTSDQLTQDGEIDEVAASPSIGISTNINGEAVVASPSKPTSSSILSLEIDRSKRRRSRDGSSDDSTSPSRRPVKLPRPDRDQLRNHLPEIIGPSHDHPQLSLPMPTLRQEILEQAKKSNSIALIPDLNRNFILAAPGFKTLNTFSDAENILYEFIRWAIEEEHHQTSTVKAKRIALLVEEKESYMVAHADHLRDLLPQLASSIYLGEATKESRVELMRQDIIITSPQRLFTFLSRDVLKITELHSLLIGDAQAILNQDSHPSMPIVQVMNNFFHAVSGSSRPRVFAIARTLHHFPRPFDSKMLRLEITLGAQILGVAAENRKKILELPDRPDELIVLYDSHSKPHPEESRLFQYLHALDPGERVIHRHFRVARRALLEVGSCASDLTWRRALKDIETGLPSWYEGEDEDEDEDATNSPQKVRLRIRGVLKNWIFMMPNLNPSSRGFNVTYKFLRLVQILESCETYGEGFRGIIFTQKRVTALVLAELLRMLNDRMTFLRPCAVYGRVTSTEGSMQQEIFDNFAAGVYNLLVATKSIEELDMPKASIVIRYDLSESPISHAYSRACTRGRESHLIHLVERDNHQQRGILLHLTSLDSEMSRWTETLSRSPSSSFPPATFKEPNEPYHSDSGEEDMGSSTEDFITDPTTSGRVYPQDATTVLFRFVARLRSQGYVMPEGEQVLFKFNLVQEGVTAPRQICTISLPGTPIDNVSGSSAFSKAMARRCACYNACRRLSIAGLLDYRIVPIPSFLLPQHQNLGWSESSNGPKSAGTRRYPRKLPDFWKNAGVGPISRLYPTAILGKSAFGNENYAPLIILTRRPLPELPEIHLFQAGATISFRFYNADPMEIDEKMLEKISDFTLRTFRSSLNKPLVCSIESMTYFLAPLQPSWDPNCCQGLNLPQISDYILWELVMQPAGKWAIPIKCSSPDEMERDMKDAIVQDRWLEFTRRYSVITLRKDLTPFSKPLDSTREAQYTSLIAYVAEKRDAFAGLKDEEQPIIEVEKIPTILNHLNPSHKDLTPPSRASAKYLIPELCAKFILPMSMFRTALMIPSILWKIDDLLIVKELNAKFFDHIVREDLLYMSISAPSAGLEHNYERLELLGDAFLKYFSSVYVFVNNPTQNEGSLHVARQKLISNKSLFHNSCRAGLPSFIRSKFFHTKSWRPPNYAVLPLIAKNKEGEEGDPNGSDHQGENRTSSEESSTKRGNVGQEIHINPSISGQNMKETHFNIQHVHSRCENNALSNPKIALPLSGHNYNKRKKVKKDEFDWQMLGDKAIADVAEAIIGAAYISGGRESALQVAKALTIPVSDIHNWSDFNAKVLIPLPNTMAQLPPGSIEAVENIIGHQFQRPHLLAQAMTHSSVHANEIISYERLEFVGDAILDFMVVRHIYDRYQSLSPGGLTLLKSAMVSNTALAALCVASRLQEHIIFESYQLSGSIGEYANLMTAKAAEEHYAAEQESRQPGQYWLEIEPPKALSDVIESIIGAVYISDNFSPIGAESFFDNVLKPFFDKYISLQTLSHHPTKTLFELIQAQGCQAFKITKDERKKGEMTTCHVIIHNTKLSSASDTTPTFAARRASMLALDALKEDVDVLSRKCDCRTRTQSKNPWLEKGYEHALSSLIERGPDDVDIDDVRMQLEGEKVGSPFPSGDEEMIEGL